MGTAIGNGLHPASITDILLKVDEHTSFSSAFGHLSFQQDQAKRSLLYLYACILAQGCNLGFSYMAQAADLNDHELRRFNAWHMTEEHLERATTLLVNAHHALDFSGVWGGGMLSSSDGQRFPMTTKGKTLKARHNPRYYGLHKGVTFYTWTSDQFSQYGAKAVPTTLRDATYVLDAILDNETDLNILEHTTDTAGYTELIFAVFDLLGMRFMPRIRDLTEQTLYRSKGTDLEVLPNLAPCLTGVLQEDIVVRQWDEMLRFVGSLKLGYVTASLVIQKLQAYPRQHPLLRALQAYGRLPKTLHILKWFAQPSFRRRAGRQLNKSESLHDLRAHLAFANQGKLGTRTNEQFAHQVGCLNLLSNIVVYYNTVEMQKVIEQLRGQGREVKDEHLGHIWPTRYQHVNVYGTYEFDLEGIARLEKQRGLSV